MDMTLFDILQELPAFFLVFTRCISFLLTSPIFILPGIPPIVKAGFAFALAVVVYPVVPQEEPVIVETLWEYGLMLMKEALVGIGMGMICTWIFNIIRMAGQMIDFQIGFAMSQVVDPVTGTVNTLLGKFLYFLTLAVFFCMDAHHGLIVGVVKSYQVLPIAMADLRIEAAPFIIEVFSTSITLALKTAVPVIAALLMVDMALGVMGRAAPQMNVFMLGFPFKIMFGLVSLAILLPLMSSVFAYVFDMMQRDILILVRWFA